MLYPLYRVDGRLYKSIVEMNIAEMESKNDNKHQHVVNVRYVYTYKTVKFMKYIYA